MGCSADCWFFGEIELEYVGYSAEGSVGGAAHGGIERSDAGGDTVYL